MAGNYSLVQTVLTGATITAAERNTEHQNHINNATPAGVDDYSVNVGEMQTVTDPYPAGVESQATSLAGELERIRYVIAQITGETYWYVDPDASIASLVTAPTYTGAITVNLAADGEILTAQRTGTKVWGLFANDAEPKFTMRDSANVTVLSVDLTNTNLELNKGAGNATIAGNRANTSLAAPSVVASGDHLLSISGRGYDGSSYEDAAAIRFTVDGTPGDGDMPGRIGLWTSADGGAVLAERWRVNNAGHLLGATDNTYDIGQSGATRPRHIYVGSNAVVGGTLAVTGATTLQGLSPVTLVTQQSITSATNPATLTATLGTFASITVAVGDIIEIAAENSASIGTTVTSLSYLIRRSAGTGEASLTQLSGRSMATTRNFWQRPNPSVTGTWRTNHFLRLHGTLAGEMTIQLQGVTTGSDAASSENYYYLRQYRAG